MVLVAALHSCGSDRTCSDEPAPEGAPGHGRGCSCGDQKRHRELQRNSECVGLAAARLGDDLTAGRDELALAGASRSPGEEAGSSEAGSSEAPPTAASTTTTTAAAAAAASAVTPAVAALTSVTAEPAGSAAGHADTARRTDTY